MTSKLMMRKITWAHRHVAECDRQIDVLARADGSAQARAAIALLKAERQWAFAQIRDMRTPAHRQQLKRAVALRESAEADYARQWSEPIAQLVSRLDRQAHIVR